MLKPAQVRFGYPYFDLGKDEPKMPKAVSQAVDIYIEVPGRNIMLEPAQVRFGYPYLPSWEDEPKMPKEVSEAVEIYTDKFRLLKGLQLQTEYVPSKNSRVAGAGIFGDDMFVRNENKNCMLVTVVDDHGNPIPELKFVNNITSPGVFLERVFNQAVQYLAKKSAAAPPEAVTRTKFPGLDPQSSPEEYRITRLKEYQASGLAQLSPFVSFDREHDYWRIRLHEFKKFPLERADELLRHPDINTWYNDVDMIYGWDVNTAEAMAKLCTTLQEVFFAQTEEEEAKAPPAPPKTLSFKLSIPIVTKPVSMAGMEALLATDMLLDEIPQPNQQPIIKKPGIKETGS